MADPNKTLGIAWSLSSVSGWGVYGTNLALQALRRGRDPVLLLPPHRLNLDVWQGRRMAPLFARQQHMLDVFQQKGVEQSIALDYPVLHALRNDFQPGLAAQDFIGTGNAGVIFFEDTAISPGGVERAREYDVIVTGST